MVKYDVKTLFDFIDACADISTKTSDTTDELEYEINLLNDIDFNDEQYSEYWVNKKSILKLDLNMDNQIVNIRGNGFALKNVYIVCKWLFYITYNMPAYSNTLTVNFYNLTIEAVLNRNSIDCYEGDIGLVYCFHPSTYATQTITHFYNCTFNTKMFAAYVGTHNGQSYNYCDALFAGHNTKHYLTFTSCIFNTEFYRLHRSGNQGGHGDFFKIIMYRENSTYYGRIVAEYCQFYTKIYLSDRTSEGSSLSGHGLVSSAALNNCFFVFDIKSVTSSTALTLFHDCNCFNTYFVLKDSAEHNIQANLDFNTNSSSSPNNWYIFENKNTYKIKLVNTSTSSVFQEITQETNAKDAKWLVDNIGFIVKV